MIAELGYIKVRTGCGVCGFAAEAGGVHAIHFAYQMAVGILCLQQLQPVSECHLLRLHVIA